MQANLGLIQLSYVFPICQFDCAFMFAAKCCLDSALFIAEREARQLISQCGLRISASVYISATLQECNNDITLPQGQRCAGNHGSTLAY